jgi:hypothetical protein
MRHKKIEIERLPSILNVAYVMTEVVSGIEGCTNQESTFGTANLLYFFKYERKISE